MQIPHDVRLVPTDLLLINLAYLIDTSCDQNDEQGLKQALNWITELETRELKSAERALLHYFHSNVWADLKQIMQVEGSQTWNWQQEYISKQIFLSPVSTIQSWVYESGSRTSLKHFN